MYADDFFYLEEEVIVDPPKNNTNTTDPVDPPIEPPIEPPVEPPVVPPIEPEEEFFDDQTTALILGLGSATSLTSSVFAFLEDSIPCVIVVCDLVSVVTYLIYNIVQAKKTREIVTVALGSVASFISLVIYTEDCVQSRSSKGRFSKIRDQDRF